MISSRNIRAAMIGSSMSLFPRKLCAEWRKRGIEVTLFTGVTGGPKQLPDGTPVIEPLFRRKSVPWQDRFRDRAAALDEWIARRHFARYRRRTGIDAPSAWEWQFYANFSQAFPIARAIRAYQPDFVFAQEVFSYGFAAALCGTIPQFLFPWGADVFWCPELSPLISLMVRTALWRAKLIMPTSQYGVDHIAQRFGISRDKLMPISWGADLSLFRPAGEGLRRAICERWKIPADARVLLNVRRLRKQWGSLDVFEAFLALSKKAQGTHFVMLGGEGTETLAAECKRRVADAGVAPRFTIIEGAIPIEQVAELMSIAAIYTSVMGSGDMRSLSVVQAAAAGGAPVLGEHPEYAFMQRQGFRTLFVQRNNPAAIEAALQKYLDDESFRKTTVAQNLAYVAQDEDQTTQMDRLLDAILSRIDRTSSRSLPAPAALAPVHSAA